jgi:hypothetical protein
MVRVIKDISVAFVPSTRARTLRDQGERWLHIFLLNGAGAANGTTTVVRTRTIRLLLLLLLLLLVVVMVMMLVVQVVVSSSRIGGSIRDRISR